MSLVAAVALPFVLGTSLWLASWQGDRSRSWDGTGHYAIAQMYDQLIFPKTFGWIDGYFGGMPFPNFYPPVFYWCVASVHRTHIFSFVTAFKAVLILPTFLVPAAVWLLAWSLSNESRLVASAASFGSVLLLTDVRFLGSLLAGLDYFSTFQIGLYTQSLGFVLMTTWFVVYSVVGERFGRSHELRGAIEAPSPTSCHGSLEVHGAVSIGRFLVSSLLLALTVLSNFFSAATAVVFIIVTVAYDFVRYRRAAELQGQRIAKHRLIAHIISPAVSALLSLFWLVPMVSEYKYFVTRPYVPEAQSLASPWLAAWCLVALVGGILWLREHERKRADAGAAPLTSSRAMKPYLVACFVLAIAILFSATIAPTWFPLQAPRFLAQLTFLITVPAGFALSAVFRWFAKILGETSRANEEITIRHMPYTSGVFAILFLVSALTAPSLSWAYAFYPKGQRAPIDDVLDFARQHQDGRYLVEVINPKVGPAWTEASFDARAINSYLGSQVNETISGIFHEASPNALFTLPVVNAFSNYPDSFGVSSVLADDLDFRSQSLSEHAKRVQFLGVKYLVIRTPAMKERVSTKLPDALRHDLGWWSVFELPGPPAPKVQALAYRPALVLSSFTVKARRRNETGFIRFAEEQFADNWFDVLLVRSPETKIDRLQDLEKFGALVIDQYDYADEHAAFEHLREFGKNHALICLASTDSLFLRLQNASAEFPLLTVVDRQPEDAGEMVESLRASYHYNSSSIRGQWKSIREALERNKIPTKAAASDVSGIIAQNRIDLMPSASSQIGAVPVLIANTFHPNWLRSDDAGVYAATPFYMLTFVDRPATLNFSRRWFDKVALGISAATFVSLCIGIAYRSFRRFDLRKTNKSSKPNPHSLSDLS